MKIPNFKDIEITKFLTDWDKEITRNHRESLSKVTANYSLLLMSPNKRVYEITVDDDGILTATQVSGVGP